MKIRRVQVENLRAIRNAVELDGLSSFEVIHGDNNSGKSSLILGIATALHLMARPEVWSTPEDELVQLIGMEEVEADLRGVLLKLPPRFNKLARHHAEKAQPIRLRLEFEGESQLAAVAFELFQNNAAAWHVQGRWWALENAAGEGHVKPLPVEAPRFAFVDAERQGPWADVWDGAQETRTTWDMEIIRAARVTADSDARKRKKAIERAFAHFVPELGGAGELGEVMGRGGELELAWVSSEDSDAQPFSEQGTGVRSIKDILVATAGGRAEVVLIEEPEVHLSASAQARLRDLLVGLSNQSRQIILSSHVHGFDGEGVWRVARSQGHVTATRTRAVPSRPIETNGGVADAHEQALRRLYVQAGQPHSGYISSDGITQLPHAFLNELRAPTNVAWARLQVGVYALATIAALEDEARGVGKESEAE